MKSNFWNKAKLMSVVLAVSLFLPACGGSKKPGSESGSTDGTVTGEDGTDTSAGTNDSTESPSWENPISFENLDLLTHDDSKLFLDYQDDTRKIYPFDDYSHVTEEKMHYFDTRMGVGIQKDSDFTKNFQNNEMSR